MQGEIIADLKPTEDPKKLSKIIKKIFPDAELKIEKHKIIGKTDLKIFYELLGKQKIKAAIDAVIKENKKENKSFVDLSKMACSMGKISLDEDFALGKIRLVIENLKE